jgi:hypothetical protein
MWEQCSSSRTQQSCCVVVVFVCVLCHKVKELVGLCQVLAKGAMSLQHSTAQHMWHNMSSVCGTCEIPSFVTCPVSEALHCSIYCWRGTAKRGKQACVGGAGGDRRILAATAASCVFARWWWLCGSGCAEPHSDNHQHVTTRVMQAPCRCCWWWWWQWTNPCRCCCWYWQWAVYISPCGDA